VSPARLDRIDYRVSTADGWSLRARAVAPAGGASHVIVLVHGIAAPLEPTYDLGVAGYSFVEELAGRGYCAVAFDHRNFGASDRDPALAEPPRADPAGRGLHTLDDSIEDIRAVVEDCRRRHGAERVTLFGSSRGAIQVLGYAAAGGAGLDLVILNNPSSLCYLSGSTSGAELAAMVAEREAARREHNYTPYTAEVQRRRWHKLFGDDAAVDGELQEEYIASCLASDAEGSRRDPPVFRVPTESFPDRVPLLRLDRVAVPVLVVEAETVPDQHVAAFMAAMPAGRARLVRIRDSNHFTLRNARRFELANLIDVAITSRRWAP
jgi:alpha-beta hydrolase superfamily lysophospholipase